MATRAKNGRFQSTKRRRRTTTTKASQPRRRSKPKISVLGIAESLVVANAVTRGLFDTNLRTFVMPTSGNVKQWDNSWEVTAPELFNLALGGSGGMDTKNYDLIKVVKRNMQANGLQAVATAVLAPMAFRFAKQVLSKPVINPANRMLRRVGIKEVKV